MECSPNNITKLEPNQIFVFGSNLAGRHGKGAAKLAIKFGARYGQGTGMMGQTYGVATKDENLRVLSIPEIGVQINKFLRYAQAHPEKEFLVTQLGCGLAGYSPNNIAPLFGEDIPKNVKMPKSFIEILNPTIEINNK